jgi:3-oxoacyl-[acyl-carrier protein] reductase
VELAGEIAVVTGGSRGIGPGICRRLADEGARIAVIDVLPADETRARLPGDTELWYSCTDLAEPAEIEDAFARLEDRWGIPRVLVNVAGVFTMIPFLDVTGRSGTAR